MTLSAHGRNGAFVSSLPLSGGEGGRSSVLIIVVMGAAIVLLLMAMVVGTGLKPDGLVPIIGIVAVGVKEKIGAGKAMLNLGSVRSAFPGGER